MRQSGALIATLSFSGGVSVRRGIVQTGLVPSTRFTLQLVASTAAGSSNSTLTPATTADGSKERDRINYIEFLATVHMKALTLHDAMNLGQFLVVACTDWGIRNWSMIVFSGAQLLLQYFAFGAKDSTSFILFFLCNGPISHP